MSPLADRKPTTGQGGLATVEFAIIVPVLLLMLLAVAEVGRALYQYNTLTKAVRDSARYYSSHTDDVAGAQRLVQYDGISGGPLLPPPLPQFPTPPSFDGEWVTVTAQYAFQFLPGNPLPALMGWFGGGQGPIVMTASLTMRAL